MNDVTKPIKNNVQNNSSSTFFLVEPNNTSSNVQTVGLKFWKKEELAEKSEGAINNAMNAIQNMAQRVNSTIQTIDKNHKPNTVEVEFGLKFDGELDIMIAKAGAEASITVTLGWEQSNSGV